jgi:hypothetical protein
MHFEFDRHLKTFVRAISRLRCHRYLCVYIASSQVRLVEVCWNNSCSGQSIHSVCCSVCYSVCYSVSLLRQSTRPTSSRSLLGEATRPAYSARLLGNEALGRLVVGIQIYIQDYSLFKLILCRQQIKQFIQFYAAHTITTTILVISLYLPLAKPLITALIRDPWLAQLRISVLVLDSSCCVHVTNRRIRRSFSSPYTAFCLGLRILNMVISSPLYLPSCIITYL